MAAQESRMKRMLIAGVFALAAAGQSLAADMPVPFPSPQPPASYYPAAAPFNWGGFYVGANGGYGFGTSSWNAAAVTASLPSPRWRPARSTFAGRSPAARWASTCRPTPSCSASRLTVTGRTSSAVAPTAAGLGRRNGWGNLRNQKRFFWHVARPLGVCVRSGPCLRYGRPRRRQGSSGV